MNPTKTALLALIALLVPFVADAQVFVPNGPSTTTTTVNGYTVTPIVLPTAVPTAAPTAAPTTKPTALPTLAPNVPLPTNFTAIVNGQPWPTTFRPYIGTPINSTLPDTGATLLANSAKIIAAMNAAGHLEFGLWRNEGGGGMPVYTAKATDPLVTVTCTQYCQAASVKINIPAKARPEAAICPGDCQMSVIEPTGVEYSLYGQTPAYAGGTSLSVVGMAWASILTGNGVDPTPPYSTTAPGSGGGNVANGLMMMPQDMPTVAEIASGVIPHALQINVNCGTGVVFPGSTNQQCAYAGPPAGARFQLVLTDAQINGTAANAIGYNAANTAPWERTILHAMHDYGAYATVTCGGACGDEINIYTESQTQYTAFGGTWPVSTFNWSSPGNNGGVGVVPTQWRPGGLNWATALQIVSPCYALASACAP